MKCVIFIALSLSIAFACENGCSGHGDCESNDKCVCYPGWGGSNCDLRSCPYSDAFVDLLPGDLDHDGSVTTDADASPNNYHSVKNEWNPNLGTAESIGQLIKGTSRAHRYAECSNAGKCDRSTGLCVCNSGFEGSACQRRSCPTSSDGLTCSGHGMCLSSEASIMHNGVSTLPSGWEYEKFGVCVCDKGWSGISCGSRICPKGIDPSTVGKVEYKFSIPNTKGAAFDSGNSATGTNSHYYEMKYDGITYTTPVIPAKTGVCDKGKMTTSGLEVVEDIRRAILSIPPLSQSKVSITCDKTEIKSIDITTPYIELDLTTGSCTADTPCEIGIGSGNGNGVKDSKIGFFQAVKSDGQANKDTIDKVTLTATGSITKIDKDSYISCSGRGICDSSSGLCQCFNDYTGLACERTRN